MVRTVFWKELERRVAPYDLLCHPYYQAWSKGELTREELREYASEYYHHVTAFPNYLHILSRRLPDSNLRKTVLKNCLEEIGHDEMWLTFATGMGAQVNEVRLRKPLPEIHMLIETYTELAQRKSASAALAAFYVYESQVPRVAQEKEKGLKAYYQADDATCYYFTFHKTADIAHAKTWHQAIDRALDRAPETALDALNGAEEGAKALWSALDGIERKRQMNRTEPCGCP